MAKKMFSNKYNRPHTCSLCKKAGHRKDSCPNKKQVVRKRENRLDKNTPYNTCEKPVRVILKTLKQRSFADLQALSELGAKKKLEELGVLPSTRRSCPCWKCGDAMVLSKNGGVTRFRCHHESCSTSITNINLAWTPLYHFARGGHHSYKPLLLAMYVFGLKIPIDAAQHLIGCSYDTTETIFSMIKIALAYAELHTGRMISFSPGTLEFDATKLNIDRSKKNKNVHCGRFVVIFHRETGNFALEPLLDKAVLKGAPPPPESYNEVKNIMMSKVGKKHVVSTDSAQAYKKVIKHDLKGVPHATVIHKHKSFTKVIKFPLKYLSKDIRKYAAKIPTSSSRTMRFRAGDQGAESVFALVKRNLSRMNLKSSTTRASINFLNAAWLHIHVGFDAVVKGITLYQNSIIGSTNPNTAFKDKSWLKSMESMD
jgi:hypothetical protein